MSNEPLNPFVVDLGGNVDTTPPVPIAGEHIARLEEVDRKPNKAGTGANLVLTFGLSSAVPALPGKDGTPRTANAGTRFTVYQPLQQSDNPAAPDFRVSVARLYDGIAGTDDSTRPGALDFGALVGREVVLVTAVENDPQYGMQARVKRVKSLN
jgi:hypothetical protein